MSRHRKFAVLVCSLSLLLTPTFGQQPASPTTSASSLLQNALAAQVGSAQITDITLSGSLRRVAGSDDETGSAVLKVISSGAARIDATLPSGSYKELCNLSAVRPQGSWSRPDGVAHPTPFHNLLAEPSWFFPAFAVARRLSTAGFVVSYVGRETHNGQPVEHVSVSQTSSTQFTLPGSSLQHLTQVEFFLDSNTSLPIALTFNTHPDNNELVDLPVEIDFSDYRSINGMQIPFHVQKSLSGSLILDFQAQTVTPNIGLSASTFGAL